MHATSGSLTACPGRGDARSVFREGERGGPSNNEIIFDDKTPTCLAMVSDRVEEFWPWLCIGGNPSNDDAAEQSFR
jgi:hypothetical protein